MKQLNETTFLFDETDHDWDDYYQIHSSTTYCFSFDIIPETILSLTLVHNFMESQDLSLRCWFSNKPLGESVYEINSLQYFPLTREPKTFNFGDANSSALYELATGKHWIMIQNLQNARNGFKLIFHK